MSTVITRVAIAALIIFAGGFGGLYYIMSGDGGVTGVNNRDLSWTQTEENPIRERREIQEHLLSEDLDEDEFELYEDEEEDFEDIDEVLDNDDVLGGGIRQDVTEPPVVVSDKDWTTEQLTKEYGPILVRTTTSSSVPQPKDKYGRPVRKNQFSFQKVLRDPKFGDEKIKNFDKQSVAREWKEYLILADENHELWDIKHKQLMEYLPNAFNKRAGGIRFGWLILSTTKKQLVQMCHRAYSLDLRKHRRTFFTATKDYEAVWDWCTLPEYWGQEKPSNWPG